MNKEEKFLFVDQEGNEREYVVLSSFFSEITQKKYVIGVEENVEIDKEITLMPFIFDDSCDQPFVLAEENEDIQEIKSKNL